MHGAQPSRTVRSASAKLAVWENGDSAKPTLILVHGFPDTHSVWDEVVVLLADRFHVVAFDVRGVGLSTAPERSGAYLLDNLALDLEAVMDAVSPDDPVHLAGHDWGAFQCWEAIDSERHEGRIASFTAIAGPRIQNAGDWALARVRPRPTGLFELLDQARRSLYFAAAQLPRLPELTIGAGMGRGYGQMLRRVDKVEPRPGHPAETIADDARAGLALYRENLRELGIGRGPGPTDVPVQLVVATRDPFISKPLFDDAAKWSTAIWRRDIRAGHWVQRSHPEALSGMLAELIEHTEGAEESGAMRRARWHEGRLPLEGKLAVVTGAGSGIGRATAMAFAAEGAEVVVADINADSARETVRAIVKGGWGYAVEVDVADGEAMELFAADVQRDHGTPDYVVNNAGIGLGGSFLATEITDWERVIDINLWGVIRGSQLFARQMVEAGVDGQIINVASAAAYTPSRLLPAYATTKSAVLMLSECMRAELADYGIGVTAICPGVVDTNITRTTRMVGVNADEQARRQKQAARAYGLRGYGPEGVAEAIVKAARTNPAMVAVTPEAKVMLAASRYTPGLVRLFARLDPERFEGASPSDLRDRVAALVGR